MGSWCTIRSTAGGRWVLRKDVAENVRLTAQDQYLQSVLSPQKDVEGLNHQFLFNLYHKWVPRRVSLTAASASSPL
jgi:hypothetical protein